MKRFLCRTIAATGRPVYSIHYDQVWPRDGKRPEVLAELAEDDARSIDDLRAVYEVAS